MPERRKETPMARCAHCWRWHPAGQPWGQSCPSYAAGVARLRLCDDAFQSTERVLLGDAPPQTAPGGGR